MAIRVAPRRRVSGAERWLPHAVLATTFVVVLPALAVAAMVPPNDPLLLALSIVAAIALSLAAASLGDALWRRIPGSRDLVFADLMLWGWLRRSIAERRLAQAEKLLDGDPQDVGVESLISLSELLEARDSRTYGHSQRVTRHAERIASTMGLSAGEVAKVRTASALHDIGKLHTPRSILNKPGRLTDAEFELIKRHPVDGAAMAAGIGDPDITAMIRHHHERLDGRGYPEGLSGEEIPLGARIIAVADTFDAITSNRTYRRAAHHKRALDVLATESGKQLDGDAVAAFRGYYGGRRTVAWSAFLAAVPQRVLAWLGGASPAIGAGVTGSAALLLGIGNPQGPVSSPPIPSPAVAGPALLANASDGPAAPRHTSFVASDHRAARRNGGGRRDRDRERDRRATRPRAGTPVAAIPPAAGTAPSDGSSGGGGGSGGGGDGGGGGVTPPEVPGPQVPDVKLPHVKTPEIKTPQVTVPEIRVPEVPGVDLPEITTPEVTTPEVTVPSVELPDVQLPNVELPSLP
jgi:putative nucleotidyltransferase with HDIG domain